MENHPSTAVDNRERPPNEGPRKSFEDWSGLAFMLAGTLMIASFLVPVGLELLTDWAWVSGIVLIGFAVIAVTIGLFGLYQQIRARAPRVALLGAVFAAIAGTTAFILTVSLGIALFAKGALGITLPTPTGLFKLISLLMAGGFSLGFLLLGVGSWQIDVSSSLVGQLLMVGGLLLLIPVLVELLGLLFAVTMPAWALFPLLGLVAVDTLMAGYFLHSDVAPN